MAVHASITLGLDFAPGVAFRKEVKRIHGVPVHPEGKSKHFYLAVSFGRAKFRLDVDSVGLALECCLGGLYDEFSVVHLRDRVFRFSVSTKSVGFMIHNLHKFSCAQFKCFFHLWGNGVPHWNSEFKAWQRYSAPDPEVLVMDLLDAGYDHADARATVLCQFNLPGVIFFPGVTLDSPCQINFGSFDRVSREEEFLAPTEPAIFPAPIITTRTSAPDHLAQTSLSGYSGISNLDGHLGLSADRLCGWTRLWMTLLTVSRTVEIVCEWATLLRSVRSACVVKGCFKLGHILKQPEHLSYSVLAGADTPPLIPDGTDTYPTCSSESPDATVERVFKNPNLPSLSFESMANFELDHAPYVPRGMAIEDGGPFRLQCTFVTLAGAPARHHESYLITLVELPPPTEEVSAVIAQVHVYYEVVNLRRHPFGLARFRMRNAIDRDVLVSLLPVDFRPGRTLRFVKHDETNNFRTTEFTRNVWVMLLGIPLYLQDDAFITQAVETFGKLEYWFQRESTDVRVLAKVIYEDATTVPRDIVVREVMVVGGRTASWTIPVYILNNDFADEFPPPEISSLHM
ncbi:hypothetical protein BRADI_3g33962v3, partial [Brachypodium distachyon]